MKSKIVWHRGTLKVEYFHYGKIFINTRVRVEKKYWNKKKQIIMPHDQIDVDSLNDLIQDRRNLLDKLIWADYKQFGNTNVRRIKILIESTREVVEAASEVLEAKEDKGNFSIATLFQKFIDQKSSNWTSVLLRRYQNMLRVVTEEDVLMDEFDEGHIDRLIQRLQAGEMGNGINTNTLKGQVKRFKSFYSWCIRNSYARENEYLNNRYKEIDDFEPDFLTLNEDQIKQLFAYSSKYSTYNKVRNTALILIYTGMRYSDFHSLKRTDIVKGHIDKISKKTKIRFKVPIHKSIEHLILAFDKPLPQQKFNYYFKKVGEDIGWSEDLRIRVDYDEWEVKPFHDWLSSHVGRHTAATRWLVNKVPPHVVKVWGGWRKDSMINAYAERVRLETCHFMDDIPGILTDKELIILKDAEVQIEIE